MPLNKVPSTNTPALKVPKFTEPLKVIEFPVYGTMPKINESPSNP